MTFEEMMEMALSSFAGKYDTQEGSFLYTILAPAIFTVWEFYERLSDVEDMVHPNEESGSYIDADAQQYGIIRKPATKASVTLTLTGVDGTQIPQGAAFLDNLGNEYIADETATIADGTAKVSATAAEAGSAGNAAANSIVNMEQYIAGVISVTNEEQAIGGNDEESDISLFSRLSAFKKRPATSGNAYSYEQWALSVAGVGAVKVYPLKDGPGTVGIVIANEEKMPVSENIRKNVADYIDEQKPIGVTQVSVNNVITYPVNIDANITVEGDREAAEQSFQQALAEYFQEIAMQSSEVKINAVGSILMNTEGIIDYSELKLNGDTANVAIADGAVPVVGEVTLHAVT